MADSGILPSDLAGAALDSDEFWRERAGGGWATAVVLLLLLSWKLLRLCLSRRCLRSTGASGLSPVSASATTTSSEGSCPSGVSELISDADLRNLMISLEGKLEGEGGWEHVIDKSTDFVSYKAKCCRPKVDPAHEAPLDLRFEEDNARSFTLKEGDGPLKYHSVTTFEKCSTDVLRDFYMDNEYRKKWDKMVIQHDQLQVDENSGTEIGRSVKKFPLLTPREYVLAWRVWEGKDKTFYCLIKDCQHPLAPQQKKYVRVGFFRSGWRIRQVPGRDACEIAMVHQEDAGLNVEMAKLAFARGIWSYVSKMNNALREYSSYPGRTTFVPSLVRLIKKVPPELEANVETSIQEDAERSGNALSKQSRVDASQGKALIPSKKWITNGLLLVGGIICLSRGRSSIGTQLVLACILKKFVKHGASSSQAESTKPRPSRRKPRHTG